MVIAAWKIVTYSNTFRHCLVIIVLKKFASFDLLNQVSVAPLHRICNKSHAGMTVTF